MQDDGPEVALVMSGGGARCAYQSGFLLRMVENRPDLELPIVTGVSAGGINAAYLANEEGSLEERARGLAGLWHGITVEQVFRADALSLLSHGARWGLRLVTGRAGRALHLRGIVDTAPLQSFLDRELKASRGRLQGVARNLGRGRLKAAALTASSYSTGRSITWVQGREIREWERAERKSVQCELTTAHVMASAALPLFFPVVKVNGDWHGDGGMRLTAPLAPAVHLGADKIIAISTRSRRTREEAEEPVTDGYPPPAQILGNIFNAVFLDQFDGDALRLERINRLVLQLDPGQRGPLRPVHLLLLRPSRDLGKLADAHEADLPPTLRFLMRGLGTKETRSNDLLSLLMFQHDYVRSLLELGARDAEAHRDRIDAFLEAPAS